MASVRSWIMASRPKTLPAAVAPVLIGTALAYADGYVSPVRTAVTLLAALLIQIGTNFANDYFDFVHGTDTPARLGPTRVTQAGLISMRDMRWATALTFLLAAVCGGVLTWYGGWPILVIGVLAIAAGVLYTAGPVPLGYVGLGDALVLVFFGFAAVGGTYYVQSRTINAVVLLAGLAPGALSTAILAVNNLRDRETDRATGKRTLAVRFGAAFARREYLGCILAAGVVPPLLCALSGGHYLSLLSVPVLLLCVPAVRAVYCCEAGSSLNDVLAETGRVLLVFSLVFSIGWIL